MDKPDLFMLVPATPDIYISQFRDGEPYAPMDRPNENRNQVVDVSQSPRRAEG